LVPDRNPYLILGVDFASSSDRSRHAFARAARRLRKQGGAWEIEDLNWALHEVEALESNPADLVTIYRVPADPDVFEPAGEGLFRPPPVALERRTTADHADSVAKARAAAARELDQLLLSALGTLATAPASPYDLEEAA
jgi:hypothetical protein